MRPGPSWHYLRRAAQWLATGVERLAKLDWSELVGEASETLSAQAGFRAEMARRQVAAIRSLTEASDRAARGLFWLTAILVALTAILVVLTIALVVLAWRLLPASPAGSAR